MLQRPPIANLLTWRLDSIQNYGRWMPLTFWCGAMEEGLPFWKACEQKGSTRTLQNTPSGVKSLSQSYERQVAQLGKHNRTATNANSNKYESTLAWPWIPTCIAINARSHSNEHTLGQTYFAWAPYFQINLNFIAFVLDHPVRRSLSVVAFTIPLPQKSYFSVAPLHAILFSYKVF